MLTDPQFRDSLFERLSEAGWLDRSWAKQVKPNLVQTKVIYTPDGLAKMRVLYTLLNELGFHGHYRPGELMALIQLNRACVNENGTANKPPSDLPPENGRR